MKQHQRAGLALILISLGIAVMLSAAVPVQDSSVLFVLAALIGGSCLFVVR